MVTKLLIRDLMMRSRVKEWININKSETSADKTNEFQFLRSPEELPSALTNCNHLVLDLNLIQGELQDLISKVREVAPSLRITGFGSHVDKELHSEAKHLGLDAVLPRSKFFGDLGRWLDLSESN